MLSGRKHSYSDRAPKLILWCIVRTSHHPTRTNSSWGKNSIVRSENNTACRCRFCSSRHRQNAGNFTWLGFSISAGPDGFLCDALRILNPLPDLFPFSTNKCDAPIGVSFSGVILILSLVHTQASPQTLFLQVHIDPAAPGLVEGACSSEPLHWTWLTQTTKTGGRRGAREIQNKLSLGYWTPQFREREGKGEWV